jgi:hypothetical protein
MIARADAMALGTPLRTKRRRLGSGPGPPTSTRQKNEGGWAWDPTANVNRVTDGARTRDSWSHNPALYLLSYGHRRGGGR